MKFLRWLVVSLVVWFFLLLFISLFEMGVRDSLGVPRSGPGFMNWTKLLIFGLFLAFSSATVNLFWDVSKLRDFIQRNTLLYRMPPEVVLRWLDEELRRRAVLADAAAQSQADLENRGARALKDLELLGVETSDKVSMDKALQEARISRKHKFQSAQTEFYVLYDLAFKFLGETTVHLRGRSFKAYVPSPGYED